MKRLNVDDLFAGKTSRYALVMGVAKRARMLTDEFEQSEQVIDDKPVLVAIDEIKDHKFNILQPETDKG